MEYNNMTVSELWLLLQEKEREIADLKNVIEELKSIIERNSMKG